VGTAGSAALARDAQAAHDPGNNDAGKQGQRFEVSGRSRGNSTAHAGKNKDEKEIEAQHRNFRSELAGQKTGRRRPCAGGDSITRAHSMSVADPCLPASLGMIAA
jgi:hypothetical protein